MMDTQPKSKNLFLSFFFFFLGMNGKETTWNQTNSTSRLVAELIRKSAWVALVIFGFVWKIVEWKIDRKTCVTVEDAVPTATGLLVNLSNGLLDSQTALTVPLRRPLFSLSLLLLLIIFFFFPHYSFYPRQQQQLAATKRLFWHILTQFYFFFSIRPYSK